jgi:hypothetical protein
MCDKLVFDLAQEIEGSPQVFVRKDWLNILDNQNQNYNNNQSVIDTSQLSNSNKWMNYREAYLSIPMLLTVGVTDQSALLINSGTVPNFTTGSIDYAYGLKNWFGQIIHSFTLDYNGTTIIQQTPLSNMWNSFRLMTSLSYNDLITQGDVIGFHPDDATSWEWAVGTAYTLGGINTAPGYRCGTGLCNNTTNMGAGGSAFLQQITGSIDMTFNSGSGNEGFIKRIQNVNFNLGGISCLGGFTTVGAGSSATGVGSGSYGSLINGAATSMNLTWKSYIQTQNTICQQTAIVATVYLKHIHSFFNMVPLLKGVFMKMTMNLNNTTCGVYCTSFSNGTGVHSPVSMVCSTVSVPTGGVNPLMVSSPVCYSAVGGVNPAVAGVVPPVTQYAGSYNMFIQAGLTNSTSGSIGYTLNLSVGATCLSQTLTSTPALTGLVGGGQLSKSVYLYIPAYTFNPPFESSYLSSPVKVIKYTDIYQYQVLAIPGGQQFNNLLTNGIANIKSVLILPYYSGTFSTSPLFTPTATGYPAAVSLSSNTGFNQGVSVFQSPFDPAGTGPTSPLVFLTNFNVQVSGQNAIYNVEKYSFEQFNNQLYGQNAVNGGLTDGLTSGLVGRKEFDMEYCYYYINVERMLPAEETVPKSIQILGTNLSSRAIDLYCFIEYGMEIKIDAMTGARV